MKRRLRDVDEIAWEGFLHMWHVIGDHASGEAGRRARKLAELGKWRWA